MSKPGKIILSGGLILGSGAYALWQHEQALPPPAMRQLAEKTSQAAPKPAAPMPVPKPATLPPPVAAQTAPTPEPALKPNAPARLAAAQPAPARAAEPAPPPENPAPPPQTAAPADVPPSPPPEPLNAVQLAPPPAASTGRYADGEFVGNSVDDEWGPVQVKVVVKNGDIADVICIEYPFHRQRSAEISEWAIPTLVEETIKAQSEKIDWVSQASFTSDQFQKSLASALARAQKKQPT
jgi:uncharacterized protein with FMN-binding domain